MGAFAGSVRSDARPGWFRPLAGNPLFVLLIAVVLNSAGWYLGKNGWPAMGGY